ncbi:hypothetical protein ACEXOS_008180 [Herbiconiux sp. P16]|uniref:hypothetical protein n=1 Tax=Herbiconiux wuyangfengii TaxID=3342794 RepID=UPI0035B82C4C
MNPDEIIESYVGDVVRRIPRRLRRDVGLELRSLLTEELAGRAADSGRPADAALAMELLTAFGRPQEVADRYRPAGFTVIRPADAPRFTWIALGGVAVQWVLSLAAVFAAQPAASGAGLDFWSRLSVWWLSWGLGAFWWPGILITFALIAGAVGSRRRSRRADRSNAPDGSGNEGDDAFAWAPARVIDRDRVNRPVLVLCIALGMLGASIVIAVPSLAVWAPDLPEPVLRAFTLDPGFLQWRAPWVLLLWAATLGEAIAALMAGRRTRTLRRISLGLSVAWLVLLVWWVAAGPIFTSEPADGVTKVCLLLVALIVVIDLVAGLRRLLAGAEKSKGVPRLG